MAVNISNAVLGSLLAQNMSKEDKTAGDGVFAADLYDRYAAASSMGADRQVLSAAKADNSPKQMSLDQYKQYIKDKISQIPLNLSQDPHSISVTISDAGLEAMKNDPEYEKWVMDGLKADFSSYDPWSAICGKSYSTHYFGATKEEYHGEGWYPAYAGGVGTQLYLEKSAGQLWEKPSSISGEDPANASSVYERNMKTQQDSEDSFWENRVRMHKKNMDRLQEDWEKKRDINRQEMSSSLFDLDGKRLPYLAGVPASVLLSAI